MDISPAEMQLYLETARRRARASGAESSARHIQALKIAQKAVALIKSRYPAARVRLFGSILYPDSFDPHSDIDIAVEGIPWLDYLRLGSELESKEPEYKIDLVDVGIVSPGLRSHIEREGIPV